MAVARLSLVVNGQLTAAKELRLLCEEVAGAVREERPRTEALFARIREAKDKHAVADAALVQEIKVRARLSCGPVCSSFRSYVLGRQAECAWVLQGAVLSLAALRIVVICGRH